jgi:hypothetical protein
VGKSGYFGARLSGKKEGKRGKIWPPAEPAKEGKKRERRGEKEGNFPLDSPTLRIRGKSGQALGLRRQSWWTTLQILRISAELPQWENPWERGKIRVGEYSEKSEKRGKEEGKEGRKRGRRGKNREIEWENLDILVPV